MEVAGRPLDVRENDDEPVWTGVQEALAATIPGVLDELDRLRAVRRLRRRASVVA